ncbi:MAG TPA: DUF937 domain-containing protein [Ilumatobacteraceae bacterium]|nr:DUF937 domain-containing protein [Ilumatobacteraceae bacterium]
MTGINDLINQLPLDKLSELLGVDPATAGSAASAAVPALVQGMQANARDPRGAASLAEALRQHATRGPATPTADALANVDTADGEKIVNHVFGDNKEQVINQLGGIGGGSSLITKLLPMLAPLVMGFLAKQFTAKKSAPASASGGNTAGLPSGGAAAGGGLLAMLKNLFSKLFAKKSTAKAANTGSAAAAPAGDDGLGLDDLLGGLLGGGGGGGLTDLLGGLLGGGRR